MADNIVVTEGTGKTIAADDIGGILYQRIKLNFGVDGSATEVSASDPLPVTGTVDLGATDNAVLDSIAAKDFATQTTLAAINAKLVTGTDIGDVTINNAAGAAAVNIQDGGNTITVDGTVTANLSATDNAVLDAIAIDTGVIAGDTTSIDGKLPALGQALAAGSVPVVLTAAQITTLTPPAAITGFATSAKQDTLLAELQLKADLTETQPVSLASVPSHAVTNTVLSVVGAGAAATAQRVHLSDEALAALENITVISSGTVTATDLDIRNLTNVDVVTAELSATDNAVLDAIAASLAGTLTVTGGGGGVQYTEGDTDATITGTAMLWEDSANTLAPISAAKPLPVEIIAGAGSGGTAAADDADFTAGTTSGTPAMGVFESSPTSVTDGDLGIVGITAGRRMKTSATIDAALPAGTNNIGDVDVLSSALPTGAATSANQTTIIGHIDGLEALLTTIDADTSNLSVVGGGTEATAIRVTIANNSTGVLSIDDNGGAITVDGTVTANLSATDNAVLDAIQLAVEAIETAVEGTLTVTGGGGGTEYTSDAVSPTDPIGGTSLIVRDDALSTQETADGDWTAMRGNSKGALWVQHDGNITADLGATDNAVLDQIELNQDSQTTLLTTIDSDTNDIKAALETVGGLVVNLGANNDVTVSGVSTAANQTTIIGHLDGVEGLLGTIDADTGSIMTAVQLLDDTVFAEDVAAQAADKGIAILAVRRDADTSLVGADNDYANLQVNNLGALKVEVFSGETLPVSLASTTVTGTVAVTQSGTWDEVGINDSGNSITVDNAALSVTGGGVEASALRVTIANDSTGVVSVDDNGSSLTVDGTVTANLSATDNAVLDAIALAVEAIETAVEGTLTVTGGGGGTEYTEDVATPNPIIGTATMIERDDALTAVTPIEGDWISLRGTAEGALWTQDFNSDAILADTTAIKTAVEILDNAISGSEMQVDIVSSATLTVNAHAVTNAGTFAVQVDGAALTALQLIDDPVLVDDATFTPGSSSVMMAGFEADETSTDSVNEGDAGAARMTLDRKQIVTVLPHTSGGWTVKNCSSSDGATALTNSAQAIKASAGQVGGWYIYNPNSSAQFVQFYNTASGSVTVGTTNPLFMLTIPATSAANIEFTNGIEFTNAGFSIAATSTAGGNGAPTSALDAIIFYK